MKKHIVPVIVLVLAVALAAFASAETFIRYAQQEGVKVYEKRDGYSELLDVLSAGQRVTVEKVAEDGKWYRVLIDYGEEEMRGWALAKYFGENPPEIEECDHEWTQWEIYRAATCTEAGLKTRSCKKCGKVDLREIEKLEHDYSRWYVVREATCAQEGEEVRWCKVCGAEDARVVESPPHEFGEWTVIRPATCTLEGVQVHWCVNCDAEEEALIPLLPHEYGDWSIVQQATDHSAGRREKRCVNCGAAKQESFDPEGTLRKGARGSGVREIQQLLADQGYLKANGVDGSYGGGTEKALKQFQTDQGLTADGVAWPQTIERLRHDFGKWETVQALTRNADGVRARTCKKCGFQETETVAAGAPILRRARGENVRVVQKMLNDLGYNAGTADGAYGPKLDSAFGAFAADNALDFEAGQLRPGDVDALANAWIGIVSLEDWMGQGSASTAVNPFLTIIPTGTSGKGTNKTLTFNWTLTNRGKEACRVYAVLLGFGEDCDFLSGNLAMAVDGTVLKANGANRASGSFGVSAQWAGENDALNFCVVAVSEKTGAKWLSNVRTYSLSAAALQ